MKAMIHRDGKDMTPLTLEEYEPQLWSCLNCYCGICVESCPSYRELGNEIVSARGLAQIGLGVLAGEIEPDSLSEELLYACTECRWCEWVCSMNAPVFIQREGTRKTRVGGATMVELLRAHKIEHGGKIPAAVRNALANIAKHGNPYGGPGSQKDEWVASLGSTIDRADTVLYVGATVPYEPLSTSMALAAIEVLRAGNIAFAMLGSSEKESGAFARMLGEEGLFCELAEHNVKIFREYGIRRIICLSPHDYDTFTRYYSDISSVTVQHYTQVVAELIERGALQLTRELDRRLTYHDPCYLARQNALYREPRKILAALPGVTFLEMKRSGEEGYCCGGGGAGLFLDLPRVNIDRTRADQISEVNPDCVAVACPLCYQMLDAAIKSSGYPIEVRDIAQLVKEALEPGVTD